MWKNTFKKYIDYVYVRLESLPLLLLIALILTVLLQIFSRYLVHLRVSWSEELAAKVLVFPLMMIGSATSIGSNLHKNHPSVSFLYNTFSTKAKRLLVIIEYLLLIGAMLFIFKEGYSLAVGEAIKKTPLLRLSFFWIYIFFPIGAILTIIKSSVNLVDLITNNDVATLLEPALFE